MTNAANYADVMSSSACLIHGELRQKRKTGAWTERHCAVVDNQFFCFKSVADEKPQVTFPLDGFNVEPHETNDGENGEHCYKFQLSKPGVVDHLFATDSLENLQEWTQKLITAGVKLTGNSQDLHLPEEAKTGALNSNDENETTEVRSVCDNSNDEESVDDVDGNVQTRTKQSYDIDNNQVKVEDFPSLDVEPVTLVTPLLHTSQSFDETNLNNLKCSTQLKRSDEIEDLLKVNDDEDDDDILIIKEKKEPLGDSSSNDDSNSSEHEEDIELCDKFLHSDQEEENVEPSNESTNDSLESVKSVNASEENLSGTEIRENKESIGDACPIVEHPNEKVDTASLPGSDLDNSEIVSQNLSSDKAEPNEVTETSRSEGENAVDTKKKEIIPSQQQQITVKKPEARVQYVGSIKRPTRLAATEGEKVDKTNTVPNNKKELNLITKNQEDKHGDPISPKETLSSDNESKNTGLSVQEQSDAQEEDLTLREPEPTIMETDAHLLRKVSVSELKELFSASAQNSNRPTEAKNKKSWTAEKATPKRNNCDADASPPTNKNPDDVAFFPNLPHPEIESSVNITFDASQKAKWQRVSGIISSSGVKFLSSKEVDGSQPCVLLSVDAAGLDIQPGAWDTGRLLAFKLMRNKKMVVLVEPDDVESLGRWVSGLFRIIQQPVAEDSTAINSESAEDQSVPNNSSSSGDEVDSRPSTTARRTVDSDHAVEPVSVKEIRAVFEEMKTSESNPFSSTASIASHCSSSTVQSVSSSHNHSPLDSTGSLSNQSVESQPSEPISFNTDDGGSPKETYLEGNFSIEKRMMERFGDKFADVVCWLGRYIEQDEEQQILANACNPFLAKLRLRHKIEMIARLEQSADDKERDIMTLKEKLAAKEASRDNVQDKYRGRLIRNAEDARRASDDQKRIDKECANIQSRINKLEKELIEIMDTIDSMHQEIQMDYEKFEYLSSVNSNGVNHEPQTPPVREQTPNKDQDNLPEWTKTAKAKKEAWKTLSKEL